MEVVDAKPVVLALLPHPSDKNKIVASGTLALDPKYTHVYFLIKFKVTPNGIDRYLLVDDSHKWHIRPVFINGDIHVFRYRRDHRVIPTTMQIAEAIGSLSA
jgi:hypothetical protein